MRKTNFYGASTFFIFAKRTKKVVIISMHYFFTFSLFFFHLPLLNANIKKAKKRVPTKKKFFGPTQIKKAPTKIHGWARWPTDIPQEA